MFVRPEKEQIAGSIEGVEAIPGGVAVIVKNSGNSNFQIQSLAISGGGFEKEIVAGYVLAGATKHVGAQFTPEVCKKISKLRIVMKSDRIDTVERTFDWDPNRCISK